MPTWQPFAPHYGTTQALTGTGTSQDATISKSNKSLRIVNTAAAAVVAYVRAYNSVNSPGTVATTADYPIPGGMVTIIGKPQGFDRLAYIGNTASLFVTEGDGI